ncbi:Uncharacterized protein dnm_007280 [Desulfonema magnum]|uniref:Uncharacterized protein n=1 Tax=Desulfonema magnum TaxID=45655 RepID=A0A975BG80_9BACT|nr:Uncharacterized protein dnm_007280 [Desulfonema magnum]
MKLLFVINVITCNHFFIYKKQPENEIYKQLYRIVVVMDIYFFISLCFITVFVADLIRKQHRISKLYYF